MIQLLIYIQVYVFLRVNVSAGRGTAKQFQIYGSPFLNTKSKFTFTPNPNKGSKSPKHAYTICYGEDLTETKKLASLDLSWLIKAKQQNRTKNFFNSFFTKLAGTEKLQNQIEEKITEKLIRASWEEDIKTFRNIRKSYLLYK